MKNFIENYSELQRALMASIPAPKIIEVIKLFKLALDKDKQIFVFGNGGSASNASHFITDLGKGSSDKTYKRFRCCSLNDNTSWITAIANDYSYSEIFVRQLMNLAVPGDLMLVMSVSGDSPNLVKAVEWGRIHEVHSIALVGGKKGKLALLADTVIAVDDTHYGRVEDAHMGICHIIAYAFMEEGLIS